MPIAARPFVAATSALLVAAACAPAPPAAAPPPAVSVERPAAQVPASAASVAPRSPSPVAALDADLDEVRACAKGGRTLDLRCPAHERFVAARVAPQSLEEEERLLELAAGPPPLRFTALLRLTNQPGPRTTDPKRALRVIELARGVEGVDQTEAIWLGRVVGAVTMASPEAREAVRALVATHPNDFLAGDALTGLGIAHPRDVAVLDLIDGFVTDPRVFVKHGVLDAYAETAKREDARACATWAKAMPDVSVAVRAGALVASSPACSAHHAAFLTLAEAQLRTDPQHGTHRMLHHLCEGPEKKALSRRVLALATTLLAKHDPRDVDVDLLAIAKCDPRGAELALRPYTRRPGELGVVARRVMTSLLGHE